MGSYRSNPASRRGFLKCLSAAGLTIAVRGNALDPAPRLAAVEMPSVPSGVLLKNGAPAAAESFTPVTSKVASYQGRPAIYINGNAVSPMIYALTTGAEDTWKPVPHHNLEDFTKIGFKLFQIDIWFGDVYNHSVDDIWRPDGSLDMQRVANRIRGVTSICPDAFVFIRIHVDPPHWWSEKYPEEAVGYTAPLTVRPLRDQQDQPDVKREMAVSAASVRWRNEAGEKLIEFLRALSAMPEGNHIAGFHVAGLLYGEWHYQRFWYEPDSGPAMTRRFREWLRAQYKTDGALEEAWRDGKTAIDTATVPGLEERTYTADGMFQNPQTQRRILDYYHCHQESVSEDILHFTHLVRVNWPRPTIIGIFYAYFFSMVEMSSASIAGGDLEVQKILNSPDIDYLSGPFSYTVGARVMGGSGEFRCVYDSIRLHQKLWLSETDQASNLGTPFNDSKVAHTANETIALNRRNFAYVLTKGAGMWWYDFGPKGESGWWDRPEYLADIEKMRKLLSTATDRLEHSVAEVLMVYDTEVFYQLAIQRSRKDAISYTAIDGMSNAAYHTGAAIDQLLLVDLPRVDLSRYKVIVFANTFLLTDQQEQFIKERVKGSGRSLVWIYAPGYTDGIKIRGAERVSRIVEMKLKKVDFASAPRVVVPGGNSYLQGLALQFGLLPATPSPDLGLDLWNMEGPVHPLLAISDPSVSALGLYAATKDVSFGMKKLGDSTSLFCGIPFHDPTVLRAIFQQSGVHIYNDSGDVIEVDNNYLAIHTVSGGNRRLLLRGGKQVDISLSPASTTFYDAVDGHAVLS
jgi:hypothetical protein